MKKQLILSFLFVFALAVLAPTIVHAMDNDMKIVKVDGDEKKVDTKKAETKTTGESVKAETKTTGECAGKSAAKCADAKKAGCCSDAKATSETKSACCADKKAEKK